MTTTASPDPMADPRSAATRRISLFASTNRLAPAGAASPADVASLVLADMLAFCESNGLDFGACTQLAQAHYLGSLAAAAVGPVVTEDPEARKRAALEEVIRAAREGSETELGAALSLASALASRRELDASGAIHEAVGRGEPFAVALLLEHGASSPPEQRRRNHHLAFQPGGSPVDQHGETKREKIEVLLRSAYYAEAVRVAFHAPRGGALKPWADSEILLLGASETGDEQAVRDLLADEKMPPRRECLVTALGRAALYGHELIADWLLDRDPTIINELPLHSDRTQQALVVAASNLQQRTALKLLIRGADGRAHNGQALVEAAKHDLTPLMRELVGAKHVHPSMAGEGEGAREDQALYYYSTRGDADEVEFLLEQGASARSPGGQAALVEAADGFVADMIREAVVAQEAQFRADDRHGFDNEVARGEGWQMSAEYRIERCPRHLRPLHLNEDCAPAEPLHDDWDALLFVVTLSERCSEIHRDAIEMSRHSAAELRVVGEAAPASDESFHFPPGALGRAVEAADAARERGGEGVADAARNVLAQSVGTLADSGRGKAVIGYVVEAIEALMIERTQSADPAQRPGRR